MKFFLARLALGWLYCLAANSARGEFAYIGFQRDMDLASLLNRYPRSSHTVNPGAGVRTRSSQADEGAWMRDFFHSKGSGTYILRLATGESHDHLFYVQAEVREGVTDRLWLLLEMPAEMVKPGPPLRSNEQRYPPCSDVLKQLTAKYGKPETSPPRWEEALETLDYVWASSSDAMKLQCGRYDGRKLAFAIGVTFERTAPD